MFESDASYSRVLLYQQAVWYIVFYNFSIYLIMMYIDLIPDLKYSYSLVVFVQ